MATNRTKYLYHVTHKSNWMSVGLQGLLTMYSAGALGSVWLVTEKRVHWGVLHVMRREGWYFDDLIVIKVRVRRSTIRRTRNRGVWRTVGNIPPVRIESIETLSDHVRSSEHSLLYQMMRSEA